MCPHNACLLAVFAALVGSSTACKTTPLDVVYAVDIANVAGAAAAAGATFGAGDSGNAGGAGAGAGAAAGGAAAGSGAVDAGPCSMVGAGRYALRSQANGLCLGQGAPTTVFGSPAFVLDFSADCREAARTWQLVATVVPNVFAFHNSLSGYVLDVQMAVTRDGTPVITFGETGFDNQHFEVRGRDAFASELRPQHHPQSCVGLSGSSAQISTCDPTDSTQAWLLQQSDCL
jgi:hypothetical protein